MKIIKNKNKNKYIARLAIVSVIITAVILIGALYFTHNFHRTNEKSPSKADSSQGATGTSTYSQSTKTNDNTDTTPATSSNIPLTIVDASQYNDQFEVRAYADITENGICTLTFIKGSISFIKESVATGGPSTSSCKTIDIPTSDFEATGDWQLNISYKSDSGKYSGNTIKIITIK